MNTMTWSLVAAALKALEQNGPESFTHGICYNFRAYASQLSYNHSGYRGSYSYTVTDAILARMFLELGYNVEYPVQHPTLPPHDAYMYTFSHWSRGETYGKNRWALLGKLRILAESKPQGEFA